MSRFLLLITTILISLYSSYARPQTFFSKEHQAFYKTFSQSTSRKQSFTTVNKQSFSQPISRRQPNLSGRRAPSAGSGDMIEQARSQANELMSSLRTLSKMPEAAAILEKVFAGKNSDCIDNMNQAIQAIETSTQLMENAGTEMLQLVKMVQEFGTITNTSNAVRHSSKIIRLLDVLIPKLTPPSSSCKTNDKDVIDSMLTLEAIISELSSKDDLYYTPQVRQSLADASKVLGKVTTFLSRESHFKFDQFCTDDKEYVKEFFTGIGNMMGDLAALYSALGPELTPENELKRQEDFIKKVIANIDKFGELDLVPLECNNPDSVNLVADALDDLAGVIEDIGMENLCNQLELDPSDCRF